MHSACSFRGLLTTVLTGAYGCVSTETEGGSGEQRQFLDQAVAGLAEDGMVICVRLALFAEMTKGKAWTPAKLMEVGGTERVGVTFRERLPLAACRDIRPEPGAQPFDAVGRFLAVLPQDEQLEFTFVIEEPVEIEQSLVDDVLVAGPFVLDDAGAAVLVDSQGMASSVR